MRKRREQRDMASLAAWIPMKIELGFLLGASARDSLSHCVSRSVGRSVGPSVGLSFTLFFGGV